MRISNLSSRPARLASVAAVLALLAVSSAPAHAGDLAAYLERAEKMGTLTDEVEADVTIKEADGSTRKAHVTIDPAGDGKVTFEVPDSGWKSETPLAWKDGTAVTKAGEAPKKITVDDPLAGTDLRGIDFFPFWKTDYSRAFTSDENTLEQTVTLYAAKTQPYSLYVITFDKAKMMPRTIKYYRDTFQNLVRVRTDKDWVMVGSRPLPTAIMIRDFAGSTMRSYTFDWKVAGAGAAEPTADAGTK